MTRIILNGCNGRMGKVVTGLVEKDPDCQIVAGVDVTGGQASYPIYGSVSDCKEEADVMIDFSLASGVDGVLQYAVDRGIPLVLCTTGLTAEQNEKVRQASEKVAILKSANMSVGINLLIKVLSQVSPILAEAGFDIEIVEKHHNQKKDAPSGTAIALADAINGALDEEYSYVYGRSDRMEARPRKEIGVSAVRGGTIPGDHEVIFAGEDEVISFSHRAYSRAIFGKGALSAAKYLKGKGPGFYGMADVLNS